jgi:PPK2 family polyphosphate:nucleotide phosphotransferase
MPDALSRYRIARGSDVALAKRDPAEKELAPDKEAGKARFAALNVRLEELQELLYAEGKHKLLVVFQAMDTAGKDSSIRHIFDRTNPQGVRVASFKKPSSEELGHDYLWRVHKHTPGAGQITIFNRSHYEDVLVVRVHDIVPKARWSKRYKHIRHFEELLADEGTTILKFFLHISKDEQKERLQDRLDQHHKHWKFARGDLAERKLWDNYMEAYEAAISETSTKSAPWFVIPANRKWYRNLIISEILVDTLEGLNMKYPAAEDGLDDIVIE